MNTLFLNLILQIGVLIFLLITFGISVIEKLTDWKVTIGYIKETFKNTFIKKIITPLIMGLLLLEIITCTLIVSGIYKLIFEGRNYVALLGCMFSGVCILYMLIGQRIAKDYVGATSLTVYFILVILGVFLLK